MLIEIILSILIGIFFGTITGLIPGIHINLISVFLITLTSSIYLNPIYGIVFISAMAITHTFIDFIPSIFLGCPDTDTELGILPGHKLLKNKRGYEAIRLSNIGSLIAIIITIIIIFPSIFILKKIYPLIETIIPYMILLMLVILILTEKKKKTAILILILTGILGLTTNSLRINQPLLPLLTGLFGASNIIISLKQKTKITEQIITTPKVNLKRPIISAIFSAPLCSFLPSMGSGQAAILGNIIRKNSSQQFLVLIGIINTLVMSFSFISLYVLNKTRTGAAIAIKEIIYSLETRHIVLIIITIILVGIISFFLTDIFSKLISKNFHKINYDKINIITLIFLTIITILISGLIGLIVLIISTITGIYSITKNIKRTNMMGVLIIPTLIWSFL